MQSIDLIRRLHEHRMWCNDLLRQAAAALDDRQLRQPFEMGRGSLWATLVHLYSAEHVWIEALEGHASTALTEADAFETFEALCETWTALDQRWRKYLHALTADQLDQPVRRVSTSSGAGRLWTTPAYDVLLHVCTHAQYTTAQAANMLRHLGVKPPDTQIITLSRIEQGEQVR
ncbi:MAG: DinB family protein [Phycisphaeraceae bacterium]